MVYRRDTPAQDREAQLAESRSAMQAAMGGTNMSTPAQDANARRQQTPAGQRSVNQQRIQTERDRADRIGQQSSPWNRIVPAATAAATAVGAARDGGPPNLGEPITQREVEQNYSAADRLRDFGGRVASAVGTVTGQLGRGTADGSGFTPQQIANTPQPGSGPGLMDRLRSADQAVTRFTRDVVGIQPLWGEGSGRDTQSASQAGQAGSAGQTTLDPTALAGARQAGGSATNLGYYQVGNGPRTYVEGTQRVQDRAGVPGLSVVGDMGAANEQFARANAIRQQTIDRQRPQNQVTVIPNTGIGGGREGGLSDVEKEIMRLAERAGRTRNTRDRARINSQIRALQSVADRQADIRANAASNATSLQRQQMADNSAWERAAMNAMTTDEGQALYNQARANYYNQRAQSIAQGEPLAPPEMPDVEGFLATGREDLAEQAILNYVAAQDEYDLQTFARENGATVDELLDLYMEGEMPPGRIRSVMERMYGQREEGEDRSYAQGGMVAPPTMEETMGPSAVGMQMGGEPVGFGAAQPPMMQEYERYAAGAQQIGVPAVPYEDFVNLMPQAQPMPQAAPGQTEQYGRMGFADGGMVPGQEDMLATQIGATMGGEDVSGREVFDPNPMAPTDSIPAVIDGQIPAALDSGEFVIPEHVVRYHGLEKLQKLIAQADKGASNGQGGTETASSSVRA